MNAMIKAQALYDLRDEFEFCDGKDLHSFFLEKTGDPSPSGNVPVDRREAEVFVAECVRAVQMNNQTPRYMKWGAQVKRAVESGWSAYAV
jgi:hypothetical protein